MKWDVHVFGEVPECIEVEAESRELAEEAAIQLVLEKISFEGMPSIVKDVEAQAKTARYVRNKFVELRKRGR